MGKKVMPKIALGAWAWGNDGTFGDHYEAKDLKDVYETAMKNGLNLWDTAVVYGMGKSEEVLAELAKDTKREDIIISDKFTPQIEDGTSEAMQNMLNGSLEKFNTDYIDVYWIHNPMDVEKYTPMLIPLAQSGQIKQIGVSNHNLKEIKRVNEILNAAGLKLSAVQNHFSLVNRSSEDSGIIKYCQENDITFYAYMVLEQGALSGNYDVNHPFPAGSDRANTYNPLMDKIDVLNAAVKKIADKYDCSVAQIATAWAIAKGTLPIIGVTKLKHVEDAIQTSNIILNEEEISYLEKTADDLNLSTIRYWEKKMD